MLTKTISIPSLWTDKNYLEWLQNKPYEVLLAVTMSLLCKWRRAVTSIKRTNILTDWRLRIIKEKMWGFDEAKIVKMLFWPPHPDTASWAPWLIFRPQIVIHTYYLNNSACKPPLFDIFHPLALFRLEPDPPVLICPGEGIQADLWLDQCDDAVELVGEPSHE